MHVLIAGCGWLGLAAARALAARGDRVTGVRSSPAGAEQLRAAGVEPLVLDLADPASAERLPADLDAILALQAARGGGEPAYHRAYLDANATLLAARPRVRAFVYTGSTGLFGQRDGSDVDEATPPAPTTPEGLVLAEAERRLLAADARVLRLSGLYGPGRLWVLDGVASGRMGLGPGDGAWMNSCHQDDAVTALLAVLDRGRDGAVYHGTDAWPLRRREVVAFVAARRGLEPAAVAAAPGPDRRVLGARTREELGFNLRWPSLLEGLEPFL
ncbi:NAD-dependent epimerase/dehydratase family protein [Geothrix sp. 21YS21S-2]|uniref:NAD-dependent epimerase/dehydratase family protein n=1 Tax=Geothrix sp. 21YS21S-2 TaxID=3068893 RepID=UPI0027B8C19D|nr:NAD-dependent epimerase/dehydratase family protein [Geothrix sp. 21YS21S-2]